MPTPGVYEGHKLLIANRGEIALRIIRTARELELRTIAIYTPSDTLAPHVSLADEAIAIPQAENATNPAATESNGYLAAETIVSICLANSVTLLHPGYGFLSENAEFASLVINAGITWLGPRPEVIRTMGLKHEARLIAVEAGVPVVRGSPGLLGHIADAVEVATRLGFPVILKATAGGGGMGMVVCGSVEDLKAQFLATKQRSKNLFGTDGLFLEQYLPAARHIEIQVFGNGRGDVVHLNERECSVQRRHQKIIEESPSPFAQSHPGLKERMCGAAIRLCRLIKYSSAGTVEFLVDDATGDFYFLEMNTRIQVEHPVTEATHPGLDLVKLMIKQGIAERQAPGPVKGLGTEEPEMQQNTYDALRSLGQDLHAHAIEGRVYAENPSQNFIPSPGLLQYVELNNYGLDWLRIESWISTGLLVTPFFDGLLFKVIVTGRSREEAIARFSQALDMAKVYGPPNNIEYLKSIAASPVFRNGKATTRFLADFVFKPRAFTVLSAGIECTVQDLPGRSLGLGIPRAGPMDSLAFSVGNLIVGNPSATEALEVVVLPTIGFGVEFGVAAVVAITGKKVLVKVNDGLVDMWTRITVPASGKLRLEVDPEAERPDTGFRVYVCIRGGLPSVPPYLGSKSTSMGLGGYQGRSLLAGDQLALGSCRPEVDDALSSPSLAHVLVPKYSSDWIVYVLPGPQDNEEFITLDGIDAFYSTKWRVSLASNRLGIRLESQEKIQWARANGGEGGSHPSNILDNGYAPGTVNINGDTPVILARDGPDMGGYVSLCTIATADMWKLGQLQAGNMIQFRRVPWSDSIWLEETTRRWIASVQASLTEPAYVHDTDTPWTVDMPDSPYSPILYQVGQGRTTVTFRQAGDSSILVEFGPMNLDLDIRARIHAFQSRLTADLPSGCGLLAPCVRSIMCQFNPQLTTQNDFLQALVAAQTALPASVTNMQFVGRKLTFPIVVNDPWNREALTRYMTTTRQKAVYLPSNIDYLARNNGLEGGAEEALRRLIDTDWLVLGVGFYLGCPFLVPIDPRCRLVSQKMNPSRTFTPRGAIGIAGPVAAIYPVESPGGYQLYGRTLPTWQTWGKGVDFSPSKPWLLQPFDQIRFDPISADQYVELEKNFDAGTYAFKIEETTFYMEEYANFVDSNSSEIATFRAQQEISSILEDKQEQEYLREWDMERKARFGSLKTEATEESLAEDSATINASLSAYVWKINVRPGDLIQSEDHVLLILEAMKMEIPVRGGERNIGKTIKQFGNGIVEGVSVSPGDILFVLT